MSNTYRRNKQNQKELESRQLKDKQPREMPMSLRRFIQDYKEKYDERNDIKLPI